jgi:large subunit ribosomal protein L30
VAQKIQIKWVKSDIGALPKHRRTLKALGLRRLNHQIVKEASPQVRGMVRSVIHLLEVKDVD